MISRCRTSRCRCSAPQRNSSNRSSTTCWTWSRSWRNRTRSYAGQTHTHIAFAVFVNVVILLADYCGESDSSYLIWGKCFGCACVVCPEEWLTEIWCCFREKQEADSHLRELKDQLEAEQYFTVILTFFFFLSAPGCTQQWKTNIWNSV